MMQKKFSWIAWLPQEIHDLSTSIHRVIHINHRRLGKSQRKTFAFWRIKRRKNGRFIAESSALVDRKSTRLNSSHVSEYRMPSSA